MPEEKTDCVSWSDTYSVGIKFLDDQHKGLLNLVNNLFSHATGNADEEHAYFHGVINQAKQYIFEHFITEEECMLAVNFPGYNEHKAAHDEFKFAVVKSINEYDAGKDMTLDNFANFLKDWIASHVIGLDKHYGLFFSKMGFVKKDGKLNEPLLKIINRRERMSS